MSNRVFQLCRVCGLTHSNPRSSTICRHCGAVQGAENAAEKERYERLQEVFNKHDSLKDAETLEELKDWIREYML
jgi:transposase